MEKFFQLGGKKKNRDVGERMEQMDMLSEHDKFLLQQIAEIKRRSDEKWETVPQYLFSRIDTIESKLDKIIQNQSQKEQQLHINFEGYELAKKPEQCQKVEANVRQKNDIKEKKEEEKPKRDPVLDLLNKLDPEEKDVVVYRFGLLDHPRLNNNEIAKKMYFSTGTASTRYRDAMRRLKHRNRRSMVMSLPEGELKREILGY